MKKTLATLVAAILMIVIIFSMAVPVAAASPPQSWLSGTQILHSENIGGTQVTICGAIQALSPPYYAADLTSAADGTFVGHTVFPNGKSTEDSWFVLTKFKGYIIFSDPALYPVVAGVPGVNIFSFDFTGNIKVNIHNGSQSNQPVFTLRSSTPISLYIPGLIPAGNYTIIQMKGWQIVHASSE